MSAYSNQGADAANGGAGLAGFLNRAARWPFFNAVRVVAPGVAVMLLLSAVGDMARMDSEAGRYLRNFGDFFDLAMTFVGVYLWTGLWATMAIAAALTLAVDGDPVAAIVRVRAAAVGLVKGSDNEPRRGAAMFSGTLCAAFMFLAARTVVSKLSASVNTPSLMALASAGAFMGILAASLVLHLILTGVIARMGRIPFVGRAVHARGAIAMWSAGLAASAVVAVVKERGIFQSLDGWALYVPFVGALAGTAAVVFLPVRERRPHGMLLRAGQAAAAILVIGVAVFGITISASNVRARSLFLSWGRNGAMIARTWTKITDRDKDGVSWFMPKYDPMSLKRRPKPIPLEKPELTHPVKFESRPDILLISIDGCRRDALGAYGSPKGRTPVIDEFAKDMVVFDDVIAGATWTTPSFTSILTGRFPSDIPGFLKSDRPKPLAASIPMMHELFRKSGYRTVAVTAGLQLDKLGFKRGFDDWQSISPQPRGSFAMPVAEKAAKAIKSVPAGKSMYMWVHFIDPHHPYEAPAKARKFGKDDKGLYAAEINHVDTAIAKVLAALKASGRESNTIVVIFADHGEAFMEHGKEFHGVSTYAEESRVPLMMKIPGVEPRRIPVLAGLVDLAPTLWDLAGLSVQPPAIRGVSLAPSIAGSDEPPRAWMFTELTRKTREFAVTTADYRIRYVQETGMLELYDRNADPGEKHDVSADRPDVLAEMQSILAAAMAHIPRDK